MKLDRNFIIPLVILLIGSFFLLFSYPVFLVIATFLMLVVLLVLSQKFNYDWGIMFFWGIIIAAIFIALLLGISELSNHYEWIEDVILWPYN